MPESESPDTKLLITSKEAAAVLSISERKLFTLTKAGIVPHVRLGRRNIRYTRASLEQFVESQLSAVK
jgi:excisionase family DNA binding protein